KSGRAPTREDGRKRHKKAAVLLPERTAALTSQGAGGRAVLSAAEPSLRPDGRQSFYRLRARTRWLTQSSRERGCGVLCVEHVETHPCIEVRREDGQPRAAWSGIL